MKLSQYGYDFSPEMLAKYPADNRDESRLMVINRAKGTIEHRIFKDIIEYFDEKDLFVFNDTKVFPARLYGNKEKTGAEIEIFLLRELNRELRRWDVLGDPARKIRIGNKLYFGDTMISDDEIALEWTRIPHFYYNYYVYQYATGFSAAIALSQRILKEGAPAVKDYIGFLSGGCSKDPISLLKGAGVDMTSTKPVTDALKLFGELIDEMEELMK